MDRFTAEVLPAGPGTRKSVPGQVRRWPQSSACQAQAQLPRKPCRASESESVRSVASPAVPLPMGSLFKTSLRRRTTRTSLSRPVHPPCGNLKPSTRRAYGRHGHIPLARLGSQKQKTPHDFARNEFLRRFLLHVLPPGFVRIRHFGLMAHRRRGASLPLCLQLLAKSGRVGSDAGPEEKAGPPSHQLWSCPHCGGPMVLIQRLTAIELRLRSPPVPTAQQP